MRTTVPRIATAGTFEIVRSRSYERVYQKKGLASTGPKPEF
jgi:hypothetical protein